MIRGAPQVTDDAPAAVGTSEAPSGASEAPSGACLLEPPVDHTSAPLGLRWFLQKRQLKIQTSGESIGVATPGSIRGASQLAIDASWTAGASQAPRPAQLAVPVVTD